VVTQSWSPLARGQMMENAGLQAIAARHGKTPAQIILRWHLELGLSVIPRSNRREGLAENFALFDFALRPEDHAALALLDNGLRVGPDPAVFS
jgi:2,5-diketo-D-gluconate reductase A